MRSKVNFFLASFFGLIAVSGCAEKQSEETYSSKDFVSEVREENPALEDVIKLDETTSSFSEVGHRFLDGMTPVQLMDCSIDNFLMARIVTTSPDHFEGDPEKLLADLTALSAVFRNALLESGFDTEEKRQSIYNDTILAKLVVTNAGATESEIMAAKGKVEEGCSNAVNNAYAKFEAASKSDGADQ